MQKILFYTTDEALRIQVAKLQQPMSYKLIELDDLHHLIPVLYEEVPDLVLLELHPSNIEAMDECLQMKEDHVLGHIPLVVISETSHQENLKACHADYYLDKRRGIHEHMIPIGHILKPKSHDLQLNSVTGLPGSGTSFEQINTAIKGEKPFDLCTIRFRNIKHFCQHCDIDEVDKYFKHITGLILDGAKKVGKRAYVGHLSSDEFVVILDFDQGLLFAENLVRQLEKAAPPSLLVESKVGEDSKITMSVAVVDSEKIKFKESSDMLRASDQIHRYLRRFSHHAFLQERRSELRTIIAEEPKTKNLRKTKSGSVYWEVMQRGRIKSDQALSEIMDLLKKKSVDVCYQPIVDFSGDILGFEALARFMSRNGSYINPVNIFQAAREYNLICDLDKLCAGTALVYSERLPKNCNLFINLNRETFMNAEALSDLSAMPMWQSRGIVLELPEEAALKYQAQITEAMTLMKPFKTKFAMDNGSGGANYECQLGDMNFSYCKLDMTLIRGIEGSEVRQGILESALKALKNKGIKTIAMGVETQETWDFVKRAGMDYAQGFFIAKPSSKPHTWKRKSVFHALLGKPNIRNL